MQVGNDRKGGETVFKIGLVPRMISRAVESKTGKTSVLPQFCKIEQESVVSGAPPCYGGLTLLDRAQCRGSASAAVIGIPDAKSLSNTMEKLLYSILSQIG